MRGNGIFHKMAVSNDDNHHSILPPQPTNLPTKTNYQSLQVNKTMAVSGPSNKQHDKNDGLRGQLRRSYDANSGNLHHAHGV